MNDRWNRDLCDPLLTKWHGGGATDHAVLSRLLDMGIAVSSEDVAEARRRLGLKANLAPTVSNADKKHPPPKSKSDPIAEAKFHLYGRLVEKAGGYWLDGVPRGLTQIMWETNRVLQAKNLEQIDHNPLWRV